MSSTVASMLAVKQNPFWLLSNQAAAASAGNDDDDDDDGLQACGNLCATSHHIMGGSRINANAAALLLGIDEVFFCTLL